MSPVRLLAPPRPSGQAGRKFGNRAAERLSALIRGVTDPDRLAEVGDWIIDCATEAEFLARAERYGTSDQGVA